VSEEATLKITVNDGRTRWEYKSVLIMDDPMKGLDQFGAQGWELCGFMETAVPVQAMKGGIFQPGKQEAVPGLLCIFKRVKVEEEKADGERSEGS